jgi:hypothetical protein
MLGLRDAIGRGQIGDLTSKSPAVHISSNRCWMRDDENFLRWNNLFLLGAIRCPDPRAEADPDDDDDDDDGRHRSHTCASLPNSDLLVVNSVRASEKVVPNCPLVAISVCPHHMDFRRAFPFSRLNSNGMAFNDIQCINVETCN